MDAAVDRRVRRDPQLLEDVSDVRLDRSRREPEASGGEAVRRRDRERAPGDADAPHRAVAQRASASASAARQLAAPPKGIRAHPGAWKWRPSTAGMPAATSESARSGRSSETKRNGPPRGGTKRRPARSASRSPRPVLGQAGVDVVEPRARAVQHRDGRDLRSEADPEHVPLERQRDAVDELARPGDDARPGGAAGRGSCRGSGRGACARRAGRRTRASASQSAASYASSVTSTRPRRSATPAADATSSAEGTAPVGLPGLQSRSARVRAPTACSIASASHAQPRRPSCGRTRGHRPPLGSGPRRRSTAPARRPRPRAGGASGSRARARASPRS